MMEELLAWRGLGGGQQSCVCLLSSGAAHSFCLTCGRMAKRRQVAPLFGNWRSKVASHFGRIRFISSHFVLL